MRPAAPEFDQGTRSRGQSAQPSPLTPGSNQLPGHSRLMVFSGTSIPSRFSYYEICAEDRGLTEKKGSNTAPFLPLSPKFPRSFMAAVPNFVNTGERLAEVMVGLARGRLAETR